MSDGFSSLYKNNPNWLEDSYEEDRRRAVQKQEDTERKYLARRKALEKEKLKILILKKTGEYEQYKKELKAKAVNKNIKEYQKEIKKLQTKLNKELGKLKRLK